MFATCCNTKVAKAKIFCDEIELKLCFAADEELGIALCYEAGPNGGAFKDPDNPRELKKILCHGKIEIAGGKVEYWRFRPLSRLLQKFNLC